MKRIFIRPLITAWSFGEYLCLIKCSSWGADYECKSFNVHQLRVGLQICISVRFLIENNFSQLHSLLHELHSPLIYRTKRMFHAWRIYLLSQFISILRKQIRSFYVRNVSHVKSNHSYYESMLQQWKLVKVSCISPLMEIMASTEIATVLPF